MGKYIIGSAIIWATVIFAAAFAVPEFFGRLIPILGGGAAAHIVLLGSLVKNNNEAR